MNPFEKDWTKLETKPGDCDCGIVAGEYHADGCPANVPPNILPASEVEKEFGLPEGSLDAMETKPGVPPKTLPNIGMNDPRWKELQASCFKAVHCLDGFEKAMCLKCGTCITVPMVGGARAQFLYCDCTPDKPAMVPIPSWRDLPILDGCR